MIKGFSKGSRVNIKNRLHIYIFPYIISIISLLIFLFSSKPTAFEWGAVELGPFFERINDHNFLINDFFTNSFNYFNPKLFWGYFVVLLNNIFSTTWFETFFILKSFFTIMLPTVMYLALFGIVKDKILNYRQYIIINCLFSFFSVAVLNSEISGFFSIGWWRPIVLQPIAQTFSFFLFFTGIISYTFFYSRQKYIAIVFWLFSTVFHPVIGLFSFSFFFISQYNQIKLKKFVIIFLLSVALPIVLTMIFFPVSFNFTSKRFVELYIIEGLAHHYYLPALGTLSAYSWKVTFLIMSVLYMIPIAVSRFIKNKYLLTISTLYLITFIFSVFSQFLFTQVIPVKGIALLGPIRYTMFSYWILLVLYGLLLLEIPYLKNFKTGFKLQHYAIFCFIIFLAFSILLTIMSTLYFYKDPYNEVICQNKGLETWIKKETNMNSVFVVHFSSLSWQIPLVFKRAVFVGNGFPLNGNQLVEYIDRKNLVYGSYKELERIPGSWVGEKMIKFNRKLKPGDFVKISNKYKVDYVIIEANFNNDFKKYKPSFSNENFLIFSIDELRKKR